MAIGSEHGTIVPVVRLEIEERRRLPAVAPGTRRIVRHARRDPPEQEPGFVSAQVDVGPLAGRVSGGRLAEDPEHALTTSPSGKVRLDCREQVVAARSWKSDGLPGLAHDSLGSRPAQGGMTQHRSIRRFGNA
jgi:hypothetical protein